MVSKKSKPKFNVMNLGFMASVKSRWRRPRGTNNAKRMKFKFAGKSPRVGYKNPDDIRGLHPLGIPEVLVHNVAELKVVAGCIVRIASQVGAKKALEIEKAAAAAKLIVANPRKVVPKEKKAKKKEAKKEEKGKETLKPATALEPQGPEPPQPPAPQITGGRR